MQNLFRKHQVIIKIPEMDSAICSRKREMKDRIGDLLLKEKMSDVVFFVDDPPQSFPCHKVILGAASEVFEAMFYGKLPERSEIYVPDVTSAGFVIMLRYLYTDMITIENESDAFEAAYASKKYMIKNLFRACENYLLKNAILNSQTVFSLYEEASFLDMVKLQNLCLRYISRNAKKVFRSKSFMGASKDTLKDILMLDLMDIDSECEIVEALWLWGEEQCKESGIKCSEENIRNFTRSFLKHVRFLTMKFEDLNKILGKFQLLDSSEQLALMWTVAMPKQEEIPNMPLEICNIARARSITNCSRISIPVEYKYDGNMSSFSVAEHTQKVKVTVSGASLTVVGAVLAFKPIPCYSAQHRSLNFDFIVSNETARTRSSATICLKAEKSKEDQIIQELVLDDYVLISEGDIGEITVAVTGEGVRLMQCVDDIFSCDVGDSQATLTFEVEANKKMLFPVKEIMCI
ncbi:BTB/POZ domain-containing protein 6-like isoform X1 [Stegodyphus dumicola]|uniref:BTB/POZ domain-containing protein 6-like isoform X1 n=2 Tax=Stegodyphus dumicola TaxID=202533 RepID=UPI0015A7CF86|nr:BTB/POZ domain-containing protein 6-like isoform X1 [Stegodyphus dumicola]